TGCRRAGQPSIGGYDPPGIRRGRGPRAAVLRAGELVSRRSRPDALRRLALRAAEPDETHVSPERLPGGPDSGLQVIRSSPADAARGLVQGAPAPSRDGYRQ